MQLTMTKSKF